MSLSIHINSLGYGISSVTEIRDGIPIVTVYSSTSYAASLEENLIAALNTWRDAKERNPGSVEDDEYSKDRNVEDAE